MIVYRILPHIKVLVNRLLGRFKHDPIFWLMIALPLLITVATFIFFPSEAKAEEKLPSIPNIKNYDSPEIRQKNDVRLENADRAARSGQISKIPNIKMPSSGVDIGQIASRYRENPLPKNEENLMIFISLSMPKEALVKLAKQAQATNALLVMRGVEGGISKGNWPRAMAALKPISDTGAAVVIHPDYFKQYQVKQVPTFVLVSNKQSLMASCDSSASCDLKLQASGDVSLDYVLELWADSKSPLANIAKNKLAILEDK